MERLPPGVRALTWAGVLPFVLALAVAIVWPNWRDVAQTAFIGYGAVILSFLGGARWGRGFDSCLGASRYAEAVTPSLIGFAALLLAHQPFAALALLAAGFAIWLVIDLRDPLWSREYKRLRLGITAAVIVLHLALALVTRQ